MFHPFLKLNTGTQQNSVEHVSKTHYLGRSWKHTCRDSRVQAKMLPRQQGPQSCGYLVFWHLFFFWCPKTSAFSRCFPAQGPPGKTHERRRTSGMRSWKNSLWISWLGSRASGRRWMVVEGSPQVHHDTMVVKQDISMRIVMVSWWNCYGPMKCLGEIVMIPWLLWPMTWMISHGDNSMTWMGRTLWTLWTLGVWYPKLFLYPAIVLEVTMEKPPLQWIKICGIPTGKSSAQDLNFWRWDGFVWKCDTLW